MKVRVWYPHLVRAEFSNLSLELFPKFRRFLETNHCWPVVEGVIINPTFSNPGVISGAFTSRAVSMCKKWMKDNRDEVIGQLVNSS